ncbi:tetratricopeptide repeat protein [Zavarzinia compransoris]|uniref:Sel1 repeat family protein n=1 Tax=Zavarzinia compransoris TaxID=1264899 RepID=A0A317E844_9PROT|nr:tetratricopeptide repeat protein [Zavarzinia compransoris]PWR23247.1 hypothetical protein DKG75_01365 [Zavarzinia compransoris]TDP46189.1 Sel1 repeat-containing protein [Zavarzinia compransoris]
MKRALFAAAIVATALALPPRAHADAIADCDRLAAAPDDPGRPQGVEGVRLTLIDGASAVAACRAAVAERPAEPRLVYQLARALSAPRGGTEAEAMAALKQAAEAGHPAAMLYLGRILKNGLGLPLDEAAALAWVRKAAEAGHARAMHDLGEMLLLGQGAPADAAAAAGWFRRGAEAGDTEAMVLLGHAYLDGTGVDKDPEEARKWFQRAIDLGSARALIAIQRLDPAESPR